MAVFSQIPADTVLAGLRERRSELADQLERLERAREAVEADLEALDRAIQLVGGQRAQAAAAAAPRRAAAPAQPEPRQRRKRGALLAAVRQALRDFGPMTLADIVEVLAEEAPELRATRYEVSPCLANLAKRGLASGAPVRPGAGAYNWSLTPKGVAFDDKREG